MNIIKYNRTARKNEGSALLVVLSLIALLSLTLAVVQRSGLQQSFTARQLADRIRATAIAEAGANEAYTILQSDWDARLNDDAFPLKTYGNGTYDVTCTPVMDTNAKIHSLGVYGSATAEAALDVIQLGSSLTLGQEWNAATNFSVLAGGTISWTGNSQFVGGGGLHANSDFIRSGNGQLDGNVSSSTSFTTRGNAGGIQGDVTAPNIMGNLSNISGASTATEVALVAIPNLDMSPFFNEANAYGEVREGNVTLSSNYAPAGGILWVNGNLTLAGNATFTGSFFATGNITISGAGQIQSVFGYPAISSRDGDISIAGQKDITGLVYAASGNLSQTGSNTLNGQIIVKGNVSKAGNSMIAVHSGALPNVPNASGEESFIGVTAWQK
ncbi:MAG: hypothetical protein O3C57_04120 [Verrucomicrobia bacterium]|nr:hypothetical protein [Verrucomicrobiota bacterium]